MVDAIPALTTERSIKLFETFGVFTKTELESRAEIQYEIYSKAINIEAKTMINMASKQIMPVVIKYITMLAEAVNTVKAAGLEPEVQMEYLKKASELMKETNEALKELENLSGQVGDTMETKERALFCREKLVPAMEKLRAPVDKLEMMIGKDMWPMPSYGDLIFEV